MIYDTSYFSAFKFTLSSFIHRSAGFFHAFSMMFLYIKTCNRLKQVLRTWDVKLWWCQKKDYM